jgi:hemerythrin-like domain-containing protein
MTFSSWADGPFPLVPTSKSSKPSAKPETIFIADDMANAHNALIRCLNSMYLQSPYVKQPADVKDLLQYAKFWVDWVHHHHYWEENMFFPAVARISGKQGIMDVNVEQHQSFAPGVEGFAKYVKGCLSGEEEGGFDQGKFKGLIENFATPLAVHLGGEIGTLMELDEYDIVAIKKEFLIFDEKMREGDKVCLIRCNYSEESGISAAVC